MQFMQAEPGLTIDRCNGTRATTTFRKLPIARPGASAKAASTQAQDFAFALTSSRACCAAAALFAPMPQSACVAPSTAIRVCRASAPRHQPICAPVTIHSFW